jgi:hypothetical protein
MLRMRVHEPYEILLACLMFVAGGQPATGTTLKCLIACQAIAGAAAEPLLQNLAESGSINSTSADSGWRLVRIRNPHCFDYA